MASIPRVHRGPRIVACLHRVTTKRGKRCTSSALIRTGFTGRSLIDIACRTTGKLTETDSEQRYRGRPKRIGTETGNSDSERLHSTYERGEPKPTGAWGGKAGAGSWDRSEER